MEDSFRVRVDKVFGNLGSDTPSSVGVSPSQWCLTDEEIEKRKWNRDKKVAEDGEEEDLESGPSDLGNHLDSDPKELLSDEEEVEEVDEEDEEDGEEIDNEGKKRGRDNSDGAEVSVDEYLDVQSNIGRDCTLDYEEEEDQFDKVAVGMEQIGDRLYMKNVKYADFAIDNVNGYGELPNTFQDVVRDPRANHLAAKIRLREDAEAAGDFGTLQLSDSSIAMNSESEDHKKGELDVDNPNNPKPILKKRENPESRSQKRVRFVFDPKTSTHEDHQSSGASDMASEPQAKDANPVLEEASDLSQYAVGVPDYLRNPSKYTRYTFDSSDDINEESNRQAYLDFFHQLRKRNIDSSPEDTSVEMPKSIVFTPKKKHEHDLMSKRSDGDHNMRESLENKSWSVGITAEDTQETEISAMEEDEPSSAVEVRSSRKSGRQYRARANTDIDDN